MFGKRKDEDEYDEENITVIDDGSSDFIKKLSIIGVIVIAVLFGLAFLMIFLFSPKPDIDVPAVVDRPSKTKATSSGDGILPGGLGGNGEGSSWEDGSGSDFLAEFLLFNDYYKPSKEEYDYSVDTFELPINIKADVDNYYDVSRKINLDPYLADLNKKGFAILDNEFDKEANDFYAINDYLIGRGVPLMLSSDFLIYYFQNSLKTSFKKIEKTIFYENLWDVAKDLYERSSTRYRIDYNERGIVNDPVLEGERMEAAFFAVILELLKPTDKQINKNANFADDKRFSENEASKYEYNLLEYLSFDVKREVELIRDGGGVLNSPILLYETDYRKFRAPDDYVSDAKLNNFYLASKWLNSLFPVYYQGETCPSCLLDREDWYVSMAAANYISQDISRNQDIQNKWASVYKILSYFSGLRKDLTYIHFMDTFDFLFGDSDISDIFSPDNENRIEDISAFQDKVLNYKFTSLEGAIDRGDVSLRPFVGMRILQEPYWPNDYILNNFTGFDMKYGQDKPKDRFLNTICEGKGDTSRKFYYRCRSSAEDVLNLIYSVDNDNFLLNSKFEKYQEKYDDIIFELSLFDDYSWQNNIYWSSLNFVSRYLNFPKDNLPVYFLSEDWQKKNVNTALGMLTNLHLRADILDINNSRSMSSLSSRTECNKYNYIEPNIYLIDDLIAKSEMISDVLVALELTNSSNVVSMDLKELTDNFKAIKMIIEKELRNEILDSKDCQMIEDFARQLTVIEEAEKTYEFKFEYGTKLKQSIEGVKLLAVINQFKDYRAILLSPIFNYVEKDRY